MARETPDTGKAVLAIGDLGMLLRQRLAADGEVCAADTEALLLFDTVAYQTQKGDLNRRERQSWENYGRITPRLIRESRELEREYAHVSGNKIAA